MDWIAIDSLGQVAGLTNRNLRDAAVYHTATPPESEGASFRPEDAFLNISRISD
jgi:hypothetical protein